MNVQDRIKAVQKRMSGSSSDERLIVHQLASSSGKYNITYYVYIMNNGIMYVCMCVCMY
jgi:hypothetical protein